MNVNLRPTSSIDSQGVITGPNTLAYCDGSCWVLWTNPTINPLALSTIGVMFCEKELPPRHRDAIIVMSSSRTPSAEVDPNFILFFLAGYEMKLLGLSTAIQQPLKRTSTKQHQQSELIESILSLPIRDEMAKLRNRDHEYDTNPNSVLMTSNDSTQSELRVTVPGWKDVTLSYLLSNDWPLVNAMSYFDKETRVAIEGKLEEWQAERKAETCTFARLNELLSSFDLPIEQVRKAIWSAANDVDTDTIDTDADDDHLDDDDDAVINYASE